MRSMMMLAQAAGSIGSMAAKWRALDFYEKSCLVSSIEEPSSSTSKRQRGGGCSSDTQSRNLQHYSNYELTTKDFISSTFTTP
jgi:hypothetical protein